jgi:hypothetical protein
MDKIDQAYISAPTTNTLGLPLMKQALADVLFHVIGLFFDDGKIIL